MRKLTAAVDSYLINALNARGWTPLALALYHGHNECARVLLEVHANPLQCNVSAKQLADSWIESALIKFMAFVRETKAETKTRRVLGLDSSGNPRASGGATLDQLERFAAIAARGSAKRATAAGHHRHAAAATAAAQGFEYATTAAAVTAAAKKRPNAPQTSGASRRAAQRRSDAEAERSPADRAAELRDEHLVLAQQLVSETEVKDSSTSWLFPGSKVIHLSPSGPAGGGSGLSPSSSSKVGGEGFNFVYDALHTLGMLGLAADSDLALDFSACRGRGQPVDRKWRTPVPSAVRARGGLYALRLPTGTVHVDSLRVARETLRAMPEHAARAVHEYRPVNSAAAGGGDGGGGNDESSTRGYVWLVVGESSAFDRLVARVYRGEMLCTKMMLLPALAQLTRDPRYALRLGLVVVIAMAMVTRDSVKLFCVL